MDDHEDIEVKKKVLRDQIPYLRQSLGDPSRYIPYLVQDDVLDSHEASFIRSKGTSKEKLETFLQLLIKDGKEVSTFDVFVAALEDLKIQSQVARRLQRTLAYEKEAALNVDATAKLDNGIQYIRDIVDDQFSKDEMTEAIKYCNMDAAAALNHLIEKATHVATSDATATTVNSHHPSTTQGTIVTTTTTVQPSSVSQLTPRTSYVPILTTPANMKEQYLSTSSFEGTTTAKQNSNIVTSSSPCVPVVKLTTTTPSMRTIGTATSDALVCPFADPQWNVTVLSHKFDYNGGTLHIHEHDIDIVIPQHAISMGDVVEVQAAAILSGPYKMPSRYDPISVTVWVGASYKFNKLIKIIIPHCAIINGPQDINGLVVLTMTSGEEFTVNTNSRRLSQEIEHPNCYCYEVNNPYCDYYTDYQCGSICLARRSYQLTTLGIMVFCWKPHNYQSADKVSVEFCFCHNLKHSIKSIKKAYKTRQSAKPEMSQWNVEVDSRKCQKFCMSYSINMPGTPAVTRRCSREIDIGDLDFQYFQSHAREKEKSSVCPSPLLVCFTRGQQSMSKDLIINFRIAVESDGATSGLQKGITFSLKLDKLTSTNDRHYDNLPCNSHQPTTAARTTDHSQEHVKETPNNTVNTVATMANHMRDNLSSAAACGNVFVKNVYVIHAGNNVSLANSEPKCAIECDVKNNYLQSFATDIATLNVNTIQMHMMKYGLLTREQQEYFTNSADTPCAKGRTLCGIILSFNESCVEKFLQCLEETSYYEPHQQLLQKIRQHSSTVQCQ